jgi:peptidoglycan/xylan/chitin deacetylase (PgdA/CDA1 family)
VFAIAESSRLDAWLGAICRRVASAGSILCFHDVTPAGQPASGSAHVTLDAFNAIIDSVGSMSRFVALTELLARHEAGRSTAGLVALTFDDAYAGLLQLRDHVERRGLPVTIFALSDAADRGQVFWWDRVDGSYPRVTQDRWRAFEDACGLPPAYRTNQPPEFGPLRPLRQWILARYAGRWPRALEPALVALEADAGWVAPERAMTFDELAGFAARGPVEIGVHTRSHPVLPLLSDEEMRGEIEECHAAISARFPTAVPVLAAPFGLYDARTLTVARESGMRSVLTLAATTMRRRSAHGDVPRICVVQDVPPWKFQLAVAGVPERLGALRGRSASGYPDLPSEST